MARGRFRFAGDEGHNFDQWRDDPFEGALTNPTERQAGHRDAKLGRGDVGIEVAQQTEYVLSATASLGGKLLDARLANRDQGEFGGDEEAISENEDDDKEESERRTNLELQAKTGAIKRRTGSRATTVASHDIAYRKASLVSVRERENRVSPACYDPIIS